MPPKTLDSQNVAEPSSRWQSGELHLWQTKDTVLFYLAGQTGAKFLVNNLHIIVRW